MIRRDGHENQTEGKTTAVFNNVAGGKINHLFWDKGSQKHMPTLEMNNTDKFVVEETTQ